MSRIRVAYGLTLNIGNYESIRLDASIEEDVKSGQESRAVFEHAWHQVQMEVKLQEKAAKEEVFGDLNQ